MPPVYSVLQEYQLAQRRMAEWRQASLGHEPEPFKYDRNLTGREIRLLRIKPAANVRDELKCTVQYSLLDDFPEYEALSYTWGSPFEHEPRRYPALRVPRVPHWLNIQGRCLEISSSLESALRDIRGFDRYREKDLVIWADAFSINQTNTEEKNCQIRIMGKIYSQAANVIVWLGPSAQGSDEAIDVLRSMRDWALFANQYRTEGTVMVHTPKPDTPELQQAQVAAASFGRVFEKPIASDVPIPKFPLDEVAALLNRAWWGRCWVVQELALAKKVTFSCGSRRLEEDGDCVFETFLLTWDTMCAEHRRQARMLDHRPWTMIQTRTMLSTLKGLSVQASKPDFKQPELLDLLKQKLSLKELLCEAAKASLRTTVPHDYIYALLGVASDADELNIEINYNLSAHEVYASVAIAYLKTGDLWFLNYCDSDPAIRSTLRSWVPDWSREFGFGKLPSEQSVAASKDEKASYRLVVEAERVMPKLALKGVFVDTITWVSPPRPQASQNNMPSHLRIGIIDWLAKVVSSCGNKDRLKVCWALACGVYPIPQSYDERSDDERGALVEQAFESLLPGNDADAATQVIAASYWHRMMNTTYERIVFQTKSGRVGLGPLYAAKGDKLVVFLGGNVPFVVRPPAANAEDGTLSSLEKLMKAARLSIGITEAYRMVGEAYVKGIMNGEVLDDGSLKVEEVLLQ